MPGDTNPISLSGIALPDATTGRPLDLGAGPSRALLTVIRHRHWLPCQEHLVRVQERELELGGMGFALIAVGFSPPSALADLARHLGWTGSFCSDEDRVLYGQLGLGRARVRQVFNPKTLALYAAAARRGEAIDRPVEDIRQLGGDALAVDGVARVTFRPASPDDRPTVDELVAAARSLALT